MHVACVRESGVRDLVSEVWDGALRSGAETVLHGQSGIAEKWLRAAGLLCLRIDHEGERLPG